jgi:hypothetical protein
MSWAVSVWTHASHLVLTELFLVAAAAEKALEITRSLIDLAKIQNNLSKPVTVYVTLRVSSEANLTTLKML